MSIKRNLYAHYSRWLVAVVALVGSAITHAQTGALFHTFVTNVGKVQWLERLVQDGKIPLESTASHTGVPAL